jgi:excisionase family DNA binding protein
MAIKRTTPIDQLPHLLRVDEAATLLDCSRGVVYELARRDALPSVRLGRLLRLTRDGVVALMNGRNGRPR